MHLKEAKAGPIKMGGGVVIGSGGIGLDSEGLSIWGKSTSDITFSVGRYGGRAYLWDIDIVSPGTNNIDVLGVVPASWDWSVGLSGTLTPYSFDLQINFEPLIDYFKRE